MTGWLVILLTTLDRSPLEESLLALLYGEPIRQAIEQAEVQGWVWLDPQGRYALTGPGRRERERR